MKKLLFVSALLALGSVAFGAEVEPPKATDTTTAEVEVRAEIVNDTLTITDIYGQPLVLDFGRIQKNKSTGKVWNAEVEYKVTAIAPVKGDTVLSMDLGEDATHSTEAVTLKSVNQAATGSSAEIKAALSLDKQEKVIKKGKDEVRGRIYGSITEDLSEKVDGLYREYTSLTATVNEVRPAQ